MVEKKTTVEQGIRGRRIKALAQAVVAFAIIIGAFALDWNIGGLKEADQKAIKPAEEKVATTEETTAVAKTQPEAEETTAVAEAQPEVAKDVTEVKKQLLGGCRNAQDFVNVNILMRQVKDFDNFGEILDGLHFVDGEVKYPEVAMNGALLKELQTFFDKVAVFSEDELHSCVAVLQRARLYNVAKISFNDVKIAKNAKEEG